MDGVEASGQPSYCLMLVSFSKLFKKNVELTLALDYAFRINPFNENSLSQSPFKYSKFC